MNEGAPPAKKPRSQLQIDAFSKARKCREEAIIKKHLEAQKASTSVNVPEQLDAMEDEPTDPVSQIQPQQPLPEVSQQPPPVQQQQQQQQQEEEYDYVSFDPDEIREQLQSTQAELKALRESLQGLHGKHSELESTWASHNVRTANMLNFV
jgi:hypothetical protein